MDAKRHNWGGNGGKERGEGGGCFPLQNLPGGGTQAHNETVRSTNSDVQGYV